MLAESGVAYKGFVGLHETSFDSRMNKLPRLTTSEQSFKLGHMPFEQTLGFRG